MNHAGRLKMFVVRWWKRLKGLPFRGCGHFVRKNITISIAIDLLSLLVAFLALLVAFRSCRVEEHSEKRQSISILEVVDFEVLCPSCRPTKSGEYVGLGGVTGRTVGEAMSSAYDGVVLKVSNGGTAPAYNITGCLYYASVDPADSPPPLLPPCSGQTDFSGPKSLSAGGKGDYFWPVPPHFFMFVEGRHEELYLKGMIGFSSIDNEPKTHSFCLRKLTNGTVRHCPYRNGSEDKY